MQAETLDATALAQRRPVWVALSDLYVDNDVEAWHAHIAGTLAASPYALDTLWRILRHEVHPVLHPNLLSPVPPVWSGFEEAAVCDLIQVRLRRPRWRRPFGCLLCAYPRAQWAMLVPRIEALRGACLA